MEETVSSLLSFRVLVNNWFSSVSTHSLPPPSGLQLQLQPTRYIKLSLASPVHAFARHRAKTNYQGSA